MSGSRSPVRSFMLAAAHGNTAGIQHGLHEGVLVDSIGPCGDTALNLACMNGSLETVKLLLKNGADPNHVNEKGSSPLHGNFLWPREWACLDELIKAGSNINARDLLGQTPLFVAVNLWLRSRTSLNLGIIDQLLKYGADISIPNNEGLSPQEMILQNQLLDQNDPARRLFSSDVLNHARSSQDKKAILSQLPKDVTTSAQPRPIKL